MGNRTSHSGKNVKVDPMIRQPFHIAVSNIHTEDDPLSQPLSVDAVRSERLKEMAVTPRSIGPATSSERKANDKL